MNSQPLQDKRVAILFTDGVEQVEYLSPRRFLEDQGAKVAVVSPKKAGDSIQGFDHLTPDETFHVDVCVEDANVADYDLLVLPGGVANPDLMRGSSAAVAFVRAYAETGKPLAAICHAPWMLIESGVAKGKRLTSWPTLSTDLRNAGADWVDEPVVEDGALITSRRPDDLDQFNRAIAAKLGA